LPAEIEIVTFSTLFPSVSQPNHGVFVENRLRHLVGSGGVGARVVAPVPYFPLRSAKFGQPSAWARAPLTETRYGIEVVHPRFPVIPKVGMSIAPWLLFWGSVGAVRRMQYARDFDLIDAHYFYPDGVAAIMLGRLLGKPVVITARGTDVNLIPRYRIPRALIRNAAHRAAGIVAVSQALKGAIVALGIPESDITVLRNGVDLELFHPGGREAARAWIGVSGTVLLSVGHLIERKGHEYAIGALTTLKECTLLIAGEGPERKSLEALAANLGVAERVRFFGAVAHADLQRAYVAADVLILASSREGWPNVLLEAMACGTPVVATNAWGNPEVVSAPEAGTLMTSRSAEGVAGAITDLLARSPDRAATRAYAEQFSWDATSQGQRKLFEGVLARKA